MIIQEFWAQTTPTELNSLTKQVSDFFQTWLKDPDLIYDLRLVLSEACTNVLLHSYAGQKDFRLKVCVRIEPKKSISIEVMDWGHPFGGPTQSIRSSGPEDECGRGLFIISQLVDSFSYEYSQGQNTLSMERHIQEHLWKE